MSMTRLTTIGPEGGGAFECGWECPYLQAHLLSDVGKKREHNEDSCMLSVPKDAAPAPNQAMLFAVADGMGGASAGERASRLTLETVAERLSSRREGAIPVCLRQAIEAANDRVYQEAMNNPQLYGMGTTASAVAVLGSHAYVVQVGDSRVYVSRNGAGLHQITNDHSIVAEQVRHGLLSEAEARAHPHKNIITRAVGIKETVEVDLFAVRLRRGDTLLICSDGLCNMVSDSDIAKVLTLKSLEGAAHRLVNRAIARGGTDNITVVLVRITNRPPKARLEEGVRQISLPSAGLLGKLGRILG